MNFIFCIHVKNHCHRVTTQLQFIIIIIIIIIIIDTVSVDVIWKRAVLETACGVLTSYNS